MGTSSSYNGPVGKNPLLPPWALDLQNLDDDEQDDSEQDGENTEEQPRDKPQTPEIQNPSKIIPPGVSWSGAKGIVSRMSNGGTGSWASAFRSYTRARGGSRTAARSSTAGKATTSRLGSFLGNIIRNGVAQAVRDLGLANYIGRDAQSLLAAFIDLLAPAGALLEEAIARKALTETITELFERYDVDADGFAALERIDADGMKEIIILSVTNYINERFEQELMNCIERGSISEDAANQLCEQAKEFISGVVAIDIEAIDVATFQWDGAEGKTFIDDLYQTAYSLLGDQK
jgi:hypothetical protein